MNPLPPTSPSAAATWRTGLTYGIAAYFLWGIMPIYFRQLTAVSSLDIVAHRIVWSLLVLALFLTNARAWGEVAAAARNYRRMLALLLTALLIGTNWLFYVYAINNGHILAGSLGYYLNPLANILLGRFILGEALSPRQWAAVGLAGAGVAVLAAGAGGTSWISLILCFSFASYGLVRKIIAVDSLAGLSIETALLFPLALGWLLLGGATGRAMFDHPPATTAFLLAAGIVSTVPLLCFTAAARRLPYSTVGMLQFLAPTLQFLLAVGLYGERFSAAHAVAFGAIWVALALYASSLLRDRRAAKARLATELGEA
jgi:chloramphenicol-sensitive protein RarD